MCLRHIPGWIIIWKFVKEVLLHDFFGRAKTKQLNIAGFPDFTAALADLAKVHTDSSRPDYEYLVTVPVGADLIVLEGLMSKFQNSVFAGDFFGDSEEARRRVQQAAEEGHHSGCPV